MGPRSLLLACAVAFVALGAPRVALAQIVCEDGTVDLTGLTAFEGFHYFAIENRDAFFIARRGRLTGRLTNVNLAPNTCHRLHVLAPETLEVGYAEFTTAAAGRRFEIPPVVLRRANPHDTDGDGLPDVAEFILGTDPRDRDTDGDGVSDLGEVQQGTNALDGLPAGTGLVASVDTPGLAVDIAALSDVVAVADSTVGVSVFNVFNGMDPRIVAQVDTPGEALRVALSGRLVAVADGSAGLAVIDFADPPAARIRYQLFPFALGGLSRSVVAAGGIVYVGLTNGDVVAVDGESGTILERIRVSEQPIEDLAIDRDTLFALDPERIYALPLHEGFLRVAGSVASPFEFIPNRRLFAGGGSAFAVHGRGFNTFDVSDPGAMVRIATGLTEQFGWHQLVANGSGLGVAVVGPLGPTAAERAISLYDVRDLTQTNAFLTTFETPGIARAVSIYNGFAYVADDGAGLQAINYLSADAGSTPPSIALSTSFDPAAVEEGKRVRVTAAVADDVQVRNVEFSIDGRKVATDGNFPFEHHFTTPSLAAQQRFTLRARASDTGGNAAFSAELTVTLVPNVTPPVVRSVAPRDGAILGRVGAVAAFFSEPIDAATAGEASFSLAEAGADGLFGTADDVAVTGGTHEFREDVLGLFLRFGADLVPGVYRARVSAPLADLAGNELATPRTWQFRVFRVDGDADQDGVPDALEALVGLDPADDDSDGDGIPDGNEDFDGDGLSNFAEVFLGTDATVVDTDGDGIPDGAEDTDGDRLSDGAEIAAATDPLVRDTDGDGFDDGEEVARQSDPLDAASLPLRDVLSPVAVFNRAGPGPSIGRDLSIFSVRNVAAPEAIAGETRAPVVSVENAGSP